ncbi:MAG: hypothetical protein U0R64_05390 [Candidatus Nanopelagicales bacterium]
MIDYAAFVTTTVDTASWYFRTPESWLTLALVAVVGYAVAGPIARSSGWNVWGTRVALWGLGGALVPTFVARLGYYDLHLDLAAGCSPVLEDWVSVNSLLNLALLVPLGAGLAWASRSLLVSAAGVVTVAVAIEVGQALSGLGACERGDFLRNALGGLAAAALVRLWQVGTGPDQSRSNRSTSAMTGRSVASHGT